MKTNPCPSTIVSVPRAGVPDARSRRRQSALIKRWRDGADSRPRLRRDGSRRRQSALFSRAEEVRRLTSAATAALLLLLSTLLSPLSTSAQSTPFTYQGFLTVNGAPANGSNDLTFTLYNAATAGATVGASNVVSGLPITNGLFTVTLNFGSAPFDGNDRWVQIAARPTTVPPSLPGPYTILTPRQPVTATPYALRAALFSGALSNAQLAGTYVTPVTISNGANVFGGSFSGNGAGLTSLNATNLAGTVPAAALGNAWKLAGNAGANPTNGAFLGTTDNLPVELKVNGERALRIEPNPGYGTVNIIGGYSGNVVDPGVVGATIHGGGFTNPGVEAYPNRVFGAFGTVGGGFSNTAGSASTVGGGDYNTASGNSSTVGGGVGNTASDNSATVGGGVYNTASYIVATVAGGSENTASGYGATVGGGRENTASATGAFVGGGGTDGISSVSGNTASGPASTVAGGFGNTASGKYATVPGGDRNVAGTNSFAAGHRAKATHTGAFVWADATEADFATTASNQFLLRATGGVGIGTTNPLALLNVNGNARIEATSAGYSEGLTLNLPTDMAGGGYGGIHFHNAIRGSNYGAGTIKWGVFYNYTPEGNVGGGGLAFAQSNLSTRLYLAADGKVGIGTTAPSESLNVVGNILATGTITPNSDRHAKTDFAPVDTASVLARVAALPLSQWRFKSEAGPVRHLGPMAQDFRAAFGLGAHETAIATVDADGVALAAIQGLNQKVESDKRELRNELKRRDAENAELKQELAEIKQLLVKLAAKGN